MLSNLRKYLSALSKDWIGLMSGIAGVLLTFWAAIFPPTDIQAGRTLLFIGSAICLFVASYRVWRNEYERTLTLQESLNPRVSVAHLDNEPCFIANRTIGKKHYRVLRIRVTNEGGEPLYNLRAQLRLVNQHYSYSNIDLTLKEEGLPIIQSHLIRRDTGVLPKPQTSFSLSRGEEQFVNVAMQESIDGKWSGVTLCLSQIGSDNYSNDVNIQNPTEFSIIVLGGIYPPYSKSFMLFLDKQGVLQLKEVNDAIAIEAAMR